MQEYNSPEEYIKDVQRYIRWSRAKVVATRELSDHINDQYDALRENGLNQKEAMRKAIEEMGDADVVGTELDIVHRPKVNWLLLLIAGVLLLSGILISAMLTSISLTVPKIIGIVLGVCVAAFLYFIDYTVLIRFPRALYGLLSLAAIFGLLYELWNGFAPLGYGFLFYLLLCYPIVLVGILFYEKNSESETKIIHYWLYAIFPLTLALINQAFPVFVLLLACELFIFCCGLKLKWLKWNRVNIFGVACMLIFLIIGVYLLSRFYHLFRLQENTGYLQQLDFFSVFREAELIGKSGMPVDVKVMSYFYDHPITLLLYEYGKFSLVFLLFVFGILFAILYRTSKKQDTEVGKLLTNTVLLIYILRIVFTALSDIGVLPNFFMCVPFVVTGGMFIIYDMALVGIILSVNRNESIAKDWTLVKHYGQEKVDEMEIECTDETQLKVANDLIAEAKDIMSYCGSGDGTNKEDCGALERYYFFDDKAVRADVSIELVTTKQENGKGYIWVKYSADYYDKDDTLISGNGEAYSRWDIEQLDGKWTVTLIDEIP